ncbi:MAG: WbqC family protein [Bacteroidota bacterium]
MKTDIVRIAIRPPEYLPRLHFIALMQSVDVLVLADTFQYSRQSFQNRTRVRTPQGTHWISIPLLGRQHGRPCIQTVIDSSIHWRSKHLRSISFNYSQTPYFGFIADGLQTLYQSEQAYLADVTCQSVEMMQQMYQVGCTVVRASALAGCPASLQGILELMPAKTLVVPADDLHQAEAAPIPVEVLHLDETAYRQQFEGFYPGTSALDLLCNYGPEAPGMVRDSLKIVQ